MSRATSQTARFFLDPLDPSTRKDCDEMASEPVPEADAFLHSVGLSDLTGRGIQLCDLLQRLDADGRLSLLAHLKGLGVSLAQRQKLANVLSRVRREGSWSEAAATPLTSRAASVWDSDPYRFVETLVPRDLALVGRRRPSTSGTSFGSAHRVLGTPTAPPWPAGLEVLTLGTGCFWGAERALWRLPGVHSTAVGYTAGFTPWPSYEEVSTSLTGHAEAVRVVFSPRHLSAADLLFWFWCSHDPTQGMGQGVDRGTQYRSLVCCSSEAQRELAEASRRAYQRELLSRGHGEITTEITTEEEARARADCGEQPAAEGFFLAEDEHQQYLARPDARPYCSAELLGVALPAFERWAPRRLAAAYEPRLPAAFWESHPPGCALSSHHAQIVWPPPVRAVACSAGRETDETERSGSGRL